MSNDEEMKKDLEKLQQFQSQLQVLILQKQNIQLQLAEIENALNELEKSEDKEVYELVGNILIKKSKDDLLPKLKDAKETLNLRITTLDKQIDLIGKKVNTIQKKFSAG